MSFVERFRKGAGRFTAVTVMLAVAAAFVAFPVGTAAAVEPDGIQLTMPEDVLPSVATTQVLSDNDDGTPGAHLTAVATRDVVLVQFWRCDAGSTNDADFMPNDGTGCGLIGTDDTPTIPGGDETDDSVVHAAFDVFWTGTLNGERDIVAQACTETAVNEANCDSDSVDTVAVDLTGGESSGEINSPTHGSIFPWTPTEVTATTDSDVDEVTFCYETPFDADTEGDGTCDDTAVDSTGTVSGATATWSGTIDAGQNDQGGVIALIETAGGTGGATSECGGSGNDCLLDKHWVYVPDDVDHVHLNLTSVVGPANLCHRPNRTTTAAIGSTVSLTGCDRDTNEVGVPDQDNVWEIVSGPGGFTSSQRVTDLKGQATATVTSEDRGTTLVRKCFDVNANNQCDTTDLRSEAFSIFWQTAAPGRGNTSLSLFKDRRPRRVIFFGTLTSRSNACKVRGKAIRLVRINLRTGRTRVVAITHTRAGGDYRFSRPHGKRRGWRTKFPGTANCNKSKSRIRRARAR